jgi:hypothetical protein
MKSVLSDLEKNENTFFLSLPRLEGQGGKRWKINDRHREAVPTQQNPKKNWTETR